MRILLDECVPKDLAPLIIGHEVMTVRRAGLKGTKNGALIGKAAERFDVFITMDRSLIFQNNLRRLPLSLIVLRARSNRLPDLVPLVPEVIAALMNIRPCELRFVPSSAAPSS